MFFSDNLSWKVQYLANVILTMFPYIHICLESIGEKLKK